MLPSGVDVTQMVWSIMSEGDWHSPQNLAKRSGLDSSRLGVVLDFLVKYGIAESTGGFVRAASTNASAPSPSQVVEILGSFVEGVTDESSFWSVVKRCP